MPEIRRLADEDNTQAGKVTSRCPDVGQISEDLAQMVERSSGIYHRNPGHFCQTEHVLVGGRSNDDGVEPVVQIPGDIFYAFPIVKRAWHPDGYAAELGYAEFESDSVPKTLRIPDQGYASPVEDPRRTPLLLPCSERARSFHQVHQIFCGPVQEGDEILWHL